MKTNDSLTQLSYQSIYLEYENKHLMAMVNFPMYRWGPSEGNFVKNFLTNSFLFISIKSNLGFDFLIL